MAKKIPFQINEKGYAKSFAILQDSNQPNFNPNLKFNLALSLGSPQCL